MKKKPYSLCDSCDLRSKDNICKENVFGEEQARSECFSYSHQSDGEILLFFMYPSGISISFNWGHLKNTALCKIKVARKFQLNGEDPVKGTIISKRPPYKWMLKHAHDFLSDVVKGKIAMNPECRNLLGL